MVMERHSELNSLIDQLNEKIEKVIDRHENEFLSAYRSHIKKIRLELDEFRVNTMRMQASGTKEQVFLLEKESVLLRGELGKLFEKLEGRNKEVDELKIRLSYAEKENAWLEKELKRLMKKMKVDQVKNSLVNTTI